MAHEPKYYKDLLQVEKDRFDELQRKTWAEQSQALVNGLKMQLSGEIENIIKIGKEFEAHCVAKGKDGYELEEVEILKYFEDKCGLGGYAGAPFIEEGFWMKKPPTEVEFRKLMTAIDADANGRISLTEMVLYLYMPGGPKANKVQQFSWFSETAKDPDAEAAAATAGVELTGVDFQTVINPPPVNNPELNKLVDETMADYHSVWDEDFKRKTKMQDLQKIIDEDSGVKGGKAKQELEEMNKPAFSENTERHKKQIQITNRKKKVDKLIEEENIKQHEKDAKAREDAIKAANEAKRAAIRERKAKMAARTAGVFK